MCVMANSDAVLFFAALEGRTNYLQTLLKAAFSVLEKYTMTAAQTVFPLGLEKVLDIYMQTWFIVSYVKMYIIKYCFIFVLLFFIFDLTI